NVRELRNLMERAVSLAVPGEEIRLGDLASEYGELAVGPGVATPTVDIRKPFHVAKEEAIESFERAYLTALLEAHGGNISLAAREAGIDRKTIHRLLNKYGLRVRVEGVVALQGS